MEEPWKVRKPRIRRQHLNDNKISIHDGKHLFQTKDVVTVPSIDLTDDSEPVPIVTVPVETVKRVTPTPCSSSKEEVISLREEFVKAGVLDPQTKDYYTFTKEEINQLLKATDDVIERAIAIMYRVMAVEDRENKETTKKNS